MTLFGLLLLFAIGVYAEPDCFLQYELGDTHVYSFDGTADVTHVTASGEDVNRMTTSYKVHLSNEVTLVGREDDRLHFQLRTVDASYVDATMNLIAEHHKAEFAKLPMQEERDAAYTRKMAEHPLYFVQSCHTGEIVQMFHAAAEDPSVLNLKKSFLQTISVRMNDDKTADHVEEHHDNHGKRSVNYSYEHRENEEEQEKEISLTTQHDTIHKIDAGVYSHKKEYLNARVADQYVHTFRGGVVRQVSHASEMAYPHGESLSMGGNLRQFNVDETEEMYDASHVTSSAAYEASGTSSVTHMEHRKRDVAAPFEAFDVSDMQGHLSKRHAREYSQTADLQHASIAPAAPKTLAEAIADLDHEDESQRPSLQALKAYLRLHDASAERELRALLVDSGSMHQLTRVMRQRVLNAVGQVGTPAMQRLLVAVFSNVALEREPREDALFAATYVMEPSDELLAGLVSLLADPHRENGVDLTAVEKHTAMVFGSVLDTLHDSGAATVARHGRTELYYRLFTARNPHERDVYNLALENALGDDRYEIDEDMAEIVDGIKARLAAAAPHLKNKRGIPEISIEYGDGKMACFGCGLTEEDPNYRGTWEQTTYSFDWSDYAAMLSTFNWQTKNDCPLLDVTNVNIQEDEGICRGKGYRMTGVRPPTQTENDARAEPNWKQYLFEDKLGFNPVYAALEAMIDMRGKQAISQTQYQHNLFAGGIVEVEVFGVRFHIVSSYMKFTAKTSTSTAQAQRDQLEACGELQFELYHKFAKRAYYAELGFTQPGCIPVRQTCKPNRRPLNVTDSNTFRKEVTFFDKRTPDDFKVGPLPVMATIIGEGVAVLHFSPPFFLYSEHEGGVQLSTTVEPEGAVRLRASASVSFDTGSPDTNSDGGFSIGQLLEGASLGAEANLEVVRVSFPASAAFNFGTLMPCAHVGISTSALGGKINLLVTILGAKIKVKIFEWKGKEWENFPFEKDCCIFCEEPCKERSECNFANGKCECIEGWDGPGCDIECPVSGCEDRGIGVLCTQEGSLPPRCKCDAGSYGFNCLLECPGGRANPCNGHGECNDIGECQCEPYWFGPACDKTCAKDGEDPATACTVNGYCYFDGVHALCECYPGHVGEKCDKLCPKSPDPRQYTCSLRGECSERNGVTSCLCDLGFYGESCEKIDFDGSGHALQFSGGSSPVDDVVAWDLPAEYMANVGFAGVDGLMLNVWVNLDSRPAGTATIAKWKFGHLKVGADGVLAFCDATADCATLPDLPLAVGEWYFVSATAESTGSGGRRSLQAFAKKDGFGATKSGTDVSATFQLIPSDQFVLGGDGLSAKLDMVSVVDETSNDVRERMSKTTVAPSTPGLLIYSLCDMGRGEHEYLEQPFLAGPKGKNVEWVDSGVTIESGSVNTDVWPRFSLGKRDTGKYEVDRGYQLVIDGKKLSEGAIEFTLGTPMASICHISISMGSTQILNDEPLTRGRHQVKLPRAAVQRLREGENIITYALGPSAGAACKQEGMVPADVTTDYVGPVTIDRSFITIFTQPSDGVIEFTGVSVGFVEIPNTIQLPADGWTMEMWYQRATAPRQGGALVSISDAKASERLYTDPLKDEFNTPFAVFDHGSSGYGVRMLYNNAPVKVETYPTILGGVWTHIQVSMKRQSSQCKVQVVINGADITPTDNLPTYGLPTVACSSATPDGWGAAHKTLGQLTLRLGHRLEGSINDLIVHSGALTPSDALLNMNMLKPFGAAPATWLLAYSFNEDSLEKFKDHSSGNRDGIVRDGVFRGLVYSILHKWKSCPGVTLRYPERVCNTDAHVERGHCYQDVEELTFNCECAAAYAGPACQLSCPGTDADGVPCNGRGTCANSNDTFCICEDGYVGDACQMLCPGFLSPRNTRKQVCNGYGDCKPSVVNEGTAECHCMASSNRYGSYCQFEQGKKPIFEDDSCDNCVGEHQECDATELVCLCADGYFPVGEACEAAPAATLVLSVVAALVALLGLTL